MKNVSSLQHVHEYSGSGVAEGSKLEGAVENPAKSSAFEQQFDAARFGDKTSGAGSAGAGSAGAGSHDANGAGSTGGHGLTHGVGVTMGRRVSWGWKRTAEGAQALRTGHFMDSTRPEYHTGSTDGSQQQHCSVLTSLCSCLASFQRACGAVVASLLERFVLLRLVCGAVGSVLFVGWTVVVTAATLVGECVRSIVEPCCDISVGRAFRSTAVVTTSVNSTTDVLDSLWEGYRLDLFRCAQYPTHPV